MSTPISNIHDLITSLDNNEWIFIPAAGNKYSPKHPAFIRNWSIAMLEAFIRGGRIYHSKRQKEK